MTQDEHRAVMNDPSASAHSRLDASLGRIATLESELRDVKWEMKLRVEQQERDLKRQQIRLDEIKWSLGREIPV
jgi:SMC interacting uncharacterized protein involved in chromosome segregation